MENNDRLNGSEQPGMEQSPLQRLDGATEGELFDETNGGGGILNSYFVLLAFRKRRVLIAGALCAMVVVFILTAFVMHPKYKAEAMIRPVSQEGGGLSGLLQSTGLMQGNATLGNAITSPPDPNEIEAILESYAFTTAMVEQEHLEPRLFKGSHSLRNLFPFLGPRKPRTPYSLYLLMSGRFDCDNSLRTGNMTLSFIDKDPELARTILDFYITRLRDQVRAQTVRDTKAALRSLENEVARTADPLLRDQMYQLIALQMQQVKTAQANADFAFKVLEPPYVPPNPYAPSVLLDSFVAGVLGFMMAFCFVAARDLFPRFRRHLAEMDAMAESGARDVPVGPKVRRRQAPVPEEDRPYSL
jgi:hypothetical protein